jgi:hypothetical protein
MRNKKLVNISLFLLAILINFTLAQDFNANTIPSVELCPCSNQAYPVTVQNTGSEISEFEIIAGGTSADWITFSPRRFVLNPGESGNFFVFVNSLCTIEGDYDLEIFISVKQGPTKVLRQVLEFTACYGYKLELGKVVEQPEEIIGFSEHEGAYFLCRDEQFKIPVLLSNEEKYENRYGLFIDAPEWADLSVKKVGLGPEASGVFLLNLNTADVEGNFNFKLSAISELGKVQRKKDFIVDVEDCGAVEIDIEKVKDVVCGGETKGYNVTVNNVGFFDQTVNLEIEGVPWARLQEDSFDVGSKSQVITRLFILPDDDISGKFDVNLAAFDDDGDELGSESIRIDATPKLSCYKADIRSKNRITNFYEPDFFSAEVKNNGIKKARYSAGVEGPDWVSVSPLSLELNPGQGGNLNLNLNPGPDIEPGNYEVLIRLDSEGAVYTKRVDINLKKENTFLTRLTSTARFYQYYIYLSLVVLVMIIVFIRPVVRVKNRLMEIYGKYKAKREKREERRRQKEIESKKKEEDVPKKDLEIKALSKKAKKISRKKQINFLNKNKVWAYASIFSVIVILGLLLGHFFRLFNAKYLHIYLYNFVYGYLFYIGIGIGIVLALFLLLLFYNFVKAREKNQVKKIAKKAEKTERWYSRPSYVIAIFIPILIIIAALAYFNLYNTIKDFFVLYSYYFVSGILVLIVVILLIKFYKPLVKFLRE